MKIDLDELEREAKADGRVSQHHVFTIGAPATLALIARIRELETSLRKTATGWHQAESVDISDVLKLLRKGVVTAD